MKLSMILRWLEVWKRGILIVCNLSIMLMVVASFLARYLFEVDFYGAEEFLLIAAFWLYFIGAAFGSFEKSHIEADFIQAIVGDTIVTRVVGYLRDLTELTVLLVFSYWSWLLIEFSIERWPVSTGWKIPMVVPQSAILVGFVLMTFHAGIHLWRRIFGEKGQS